MKTMDIANKLVELCRSGRGGEALSLYAPDAVSVEAGGPPGQDPVSRGVPAIKAKGEWWVSNHDIHSASCTGPWPNGDKFIVGFQYDVTNKPSGKRMKMDEMALYTVADGKIVKEEFFYSMG